MIKKIIILMALSASVLLLGWLAWDRIFSKTVQSKVVTPQPEVSQEPSLPRLQVGDEVIQVEIADEPEEMQRGLSGRKELVEGTGMLFLFTPAQNVWFWMPDMHFSIDMLFIRSGKIVHLEPNVPFFPADYPEADLPRYDPGQKVDMVLEVPAGWSEKHGIEIGDAVGLQ